MAMGYAYALLGHAHSILVMTMAMVMNIAMVMNMANVYVLNIMHKQ